MATIFSLPDELLLKVFSYLDASTVALSVANVCTHWNSLTGDYLLWDDLKFSVDKDMDLSEVLRILSQLRDLRFIDLHWRMDTSDILDALREQCPYLIGVHIICCGFMDRDFIRQLGNSCRNLQTLSLGKGWSAPSQCLDDIVLLTNLTTLNLSGSLLNPDQFRSVSLNGPMLTSINIDYVRGTSEQSLIEFISLRYSILESLRVFGEFLTDNIFLHISLCPKLRLLHLSNCRLITDVCLERIDTLGHLRSLTMKKAVKLSSQGLWNFYFKSNMVQNLTHLYISAKRCVQSEDVSLWIHNYSNMDFNLVDQFCNSILSKNGFKVEKC